MGVGRYELSDAQWSQIEGLLPGRVESVGRTVAWIAKWRKYLGARLSGTSSEGIYGTYDSLWLMAFAIRRIVESRLY
jgi:hypothetical protein